MGRPDLTVLAIPAFVGAMAAEVLWQRRNPAPAGTPRDIVVRMQQEVGRALGTPELKEAWRNLGAEAGGQSPEEMARFVDGEIVKWGQVVKASGAKLD